MNLSSLGSALSSAVDAPLTTDPVGQIQAQAQVSILKKALQAQSDSVTTLIASVTGNVGRNLDVRG
jgi:Putative motility protein